MKNFIFISIFVSMITPTTWAQDLLVPSGDVKVTDISFRGSGCADGTVDAYVSPDKQALSLLFNEFTADSSASATSADQKNCAVNLKLKTPPGWQYSLFCVDYYGFADLDAGVTGVQAANFRINQSKMMAFGRHVIKGPYVDDYSKIYQVPLSDLPYSGCAGNETVLNINSRVRVFAAPASEVIRLSSSRYRRKTQDMGKKIKGMKLIKKYSRSSCRQYRSYGFRGTRAWVNRGCQADFEITFAGGGPSAAPSQAAGIMTVDEIEGHVKQHYGISWRKCSAGKWVQTKKKSCNRVCSDVGMRSAKDSSGAQCASGESRPASAIGKIKFSYGCWPNCAPHRGLATESIGKYCYHRGQKRDSDKTDRTVGCFCK